jgi:hypothetical protein
VFGNAIGNSVVSNMQESAAAERAAQNQRYKDAIGPDGTGPIVGNGNRLSMHLPPTDALSPPDTTDGSPVIGRRRNLLYVPGADSARLQPVSEIGGHFTTPQLVGQAFVGAYSPTLGREFTQNDLNEMVAFSQVPDQLKGFDAFAAGVRYHNPFARSFLSSDVRLLQESLHVLNEFGAEFNQDWTLNLVKGNPDLKLAGMAMHPFVDSRPHEGHGTVYGHAGESLSGHSPDFMTPERAKILAPDLIRYFEAVTGIGADTVFGGDDASIRTRALGTVNRAAALASDTGATNAAFEREYNLAARALLPEAALTLPTLPRPSISYLWGDTREGALVKSAEYLQSINFRVDPERFLDDALDAYVGIANRYVRVTGGQLSSGERVVPIDRQRLLPNPVPPRIPDPYYGGA